MGESARIGRVSALDGFRGVAVVLVVLFHFDTLFGLRGGTIGVEMFFVLSGFIITTTLLAEFERTGSISFMNFFARRILRLYPALLITVALFGSLSLVLGVSRPDELSKSVVAALLYFTNVVRAYSLWDTVWLGHTWSLSIEEQFYVIWPFVLLPLVRFRHSRTAFGVMVAVVMALWFHRQMLIENGAADVRVYNGFDTRCAAIFIGCAVALFVRSGILSATALRRVVTFAGPIACLAIVWQLIGPRVWLFQVVPCASAVTVLALVLCSRGWLSQLLSARWLVWIGTRSYAIYLYHYPLWFLSLGTTMHGWWPHATNQLIGLFVLLPVTLVLAWLSYRYVEEPALRLQERFRRRGRAVELRDGRLVDGEEPAAIRL